MTGLFKNTPDGLCGNDDCGQMSAWYIFSSLGFYPVCPGDGVYVIGKPCLKKATINLANGKTFTMTASNLSDKNIYIQRVKLNGKSWHKSFIYHADIIKGGLLEFHMGPKPNKKWASSPSSYPPSISK
jgi:putative alpha-1,2-mannosidase